MLCYVYFTTIREERSPSSLLVTGQPPTFCFVNNSVTFASSIDALWSPLLLWGCGRARLACLLGQGGPPVNSGLEHTPCRLAGGLLSAHPPCT